jgi:hypothetical protein
MTESPEHLRLSSLGRSGRQFHLCYSLKGVTLKKQSTMDPESSEWSVRKAAIHHQLDVVHGTTLWTVTKGLLDLQVRFRELTRPGHSMFDNECECFRAALAAQGGSAAQV